MTATSSTTAARGTAVPADVPSGAATPGAGARHEGESKAVPPGSATASRRRVLLIGGDAASVRTVLPADVEPDSHETILDALLGFTPETRYLGIFASVSQEVDELEHAVRSLRKAAGESPLVLLCEPADEPVCRRARAWGADDYLVVPTSKAAVERVLGRASEVIAPRRRGSPAQALAAPVQLDVAQLPLLVDCALVNDLLSGRTDFVDRAVASLQGYMRWPGKLRFEAKMPEPAPVEASQALRASVALAGNTFGTLVLEPRAGESDATHAAAMLGQAAAWLAGWMAISHRNEQLRTLAITDELTGAYNRRYFKRFTSSLLERAKVERFRVSVLLFDIDNFKRYNDEYGHPAGDGIIREVIRLLRTCTRPHDLVARLGGDEFAVVFWDNEPPRQPGSQHPKDAVTATERFRRVLASHDWSQGCNIKGEVSISGGLSTFPWDGDTVEMLVDRADEALLRAKAMGKNAILLHEADCGE